MDNPTNSTTTRDHGTEAQRHTNARLEWASLFASQPSSTGICTTTDGEQSTTQNASSLSAENLRTNTPWGDTITEQKAEGITRIYCQNVNGFTLDQEGGQFGSFCKLHQEIQADISCCQEINLDTTNCSKRSMSLHAPIDWNSLETDITMQKNWIWTWFQEA